jgi:hypothetical protein
VEVVRVAALLKPRGVRGWVVVAVVLTLAAGLALAGLSSRPEGVDHPRADGFLTVPVDPVGADLARGRQTLAGALSKVDEAAASGAAGIRMTADVRWLCPTPICDTAPLAPLVDRATASGLDVYVQVNSTPEWMDGRDRWYPPLGADVEAWAKLFGQFVGRYGTEVTGYEVWNEPNSEDFWRPGPDAGAYADLLKAVWSEVQKVDGEVALVGGVLSNNDLGYMAELDQALKARGGNPDNGYYYDLLGMHPYTGAEGIGYDPRTPAGSADVETETGIKDMTFLGIDRLRTQVAEDEGIWRDAVIGEFGYDTAPGNWYHVEEPRRAEYLATALRLAEGRRWIRSFAVYSYSDDPANGFSILGTPSEAAVRKAGLTRSHPPDVQRQLTG